jgi:hypothetical protein
VAYSARKQCANGDTKAEAHRTQQERIGLCEMAQVAALRQAHIPKMGAFGGIMRPAIGTADRFPAAA